MKSLKMNVIFNLIPLLIVLILCLLWAKYDYISAKITYWQILFVAFIMPIYLSIINIIYAIKNDIYLFVHKMLLMIVIEMLSAFLAIWTWAIVDGPGDTNPMHVSYYVDPVTRSIINAAWQLAAIIILLIGGTFQIIRMIKYIKLKKIFRDFNVESYNKKYSEGYFEHFIASGHNEKSFKEHAELYYDFEGLDEYKKLINEIYLINKNNDWPYFACLAKEYGREYLNIENIRKLANTAIEVFNERNKS